MVIVPKGACELNLNGYWEVGINREYSSKTRVPGLIGDPTTITEGILWYKKKIKLPDGYWKNATLVLKGARFCPSVYVNGHKLSMSTGGMAPTTHFLDHPSIKPGTTIQLEIALQPLDEVALTDASRIPEADLWRTNVLSCLWDDVILKLHGDYQINRVIPDPDLDNDCLSVNWEILSHGDEQSLESLKMIFRVLDQNGEMLIERSVYDIDLTGVITMDLNRKCRPWTVDDPICYTLQVILNRHSMTLDINEITIGLKKFTTSKTGFMLNNEPITLRAGTVVWHRWLRDPESTELAFDEQWFRTNIVQRLKDHGANMLRFHLGMPPERFLTLCDKYGLLVQAEWIFFHGMKASKASLIEQWRCWLDLCMQHPSTAIIHPWNETKGDELEVACSALEELLPWYPPLVVSHKDVIHIHKYWWSLFENVGLFYDSATEFEKPIMVDEFGGNYLDGDGNPGKYPSVNESFLRFLGRNHTKDMRLQLQNDANARIAEYWRRIGAAGFSPFCILGSPEDGSHHFMGLLADGNPKPVWQALTAAYSPLSCSLEIWDRNFYPGQAVTLPIYFFNDIDKPKQLFANIQICDQDSGSVISSELVTCVCKPHSKTIKKITVRLPKKTGAWQFQAVLQNPPKPIKYPVKSIWRFRTLAQKVPDMARKVKIGVPSWEPELQEFLSKNTIYIHNIKEEDLDLVITSRLTWEKLIDDQELKVHFQTLIESGCSIVMLDVGPRNLYPPGHHMALQGMFMPKSYERKEFELFRKIRLKFKQVPEPESCIHAAEATSALWDNLEQEATWLWNGLRGGLIVPAWDWEICGLGPEDILNQWVSRGADGDKITATGNYHAYELEGFYSFADSHNPEAIIQLKNKVQLLVEDAPALEKAINPNGPVKVHHLSALYKQATRGAAYKVEPLVTAGKGLTRTPVMLFDFGENQGRVLLSQLITEGRLADGYGEAGLYGIRTDPAAGQFVLNMIKQAIS